MKHELKVITLATAMAMLGACAGGGGNTSSGPESLAPVNSAYADAKARAAQCYANPTQACLIYELMYGEECKILPNRCTASVLLWEKFPPDESNTTTLPNFIVDPSNPDTWPSADQTTVDPVLFTSWDTPHDIGVRADGLLGMAVVNHSADGEHISPTHVGHGGGGVILVYEPSGQLREFRNGEGSFAPDPGLTGRYGQPGIDAAWSTTNSQQTAFTAVETDGVALVANPYDSGWNYQSFGVWTRPGTAATEYVRGVSFGAATPGPAIPSSGYATFTGKLAGMYVSSAGNGSIATSDLGVHVDFGTRSLSLASTGTMAHNGLIWTPSPGLDVSGTLSYSPGSGVFSGTLVNAAGTMGGTSNGQFYGPAAQELGGEFVLKSPTTVETFVGAYGAKR